MSWLKSCAGKHKAQRKNVRHDLTAIVPMSDRLRGPVEAEARPEVNAAVAGCGAGKHESGKALTNLRECVSSRPTREPGYRLMRADTAEYLTRAQFPVGP